MSEILEREKADDLADDLGRLPNVVGSENVGDDDPEKKVCSCGASVSKTKKKAGKGGPKKPKAKKETKAKAAKAPKSKIVKKRGSAGNPSKLGGVKSKKVKKSAVDGAADVAADVAVDETDDGVSLSVDETMGDVVFGGNDEEMVIANTTEVGANM